jgi:high-affinity iron transporter
MGAWFEMYSTWETLGVQAVAAVFVVGSYYLAEYLKVKRPRRMGAEPAVRAEAPPAPSSPSLRSPEPGF